MSLENGWINEYSIAYSEVMKCGNMICNKCGKEIKGLYLVRDRTNFKHRGNETDERYIYHREFRKNKAWEEYEKAVKKAREEADDYERRLKEVKDLMEKNNIEICDIE